MSVEHTIRAADGGMITFGAYTRGFAIKAHCTECMGWESSPADCTAITCALYPFRGKTLRTRKGSKVGSTGQKSTLETVGASSEGGSPQGEGSEPLEASRSDNDQSVISKESE